MVKLSRNNPLPRRKFLKHGAALTAAAMAGQMGFGTRSIAMTTQGPFRTRDELGASLASAGVLPEDQRMLLDMALPALALQSTAAADHEIPIGASKIGGAPDLPHSFPWPMRAPTTAGNASIKALQELLAQMEARTFAPDYFTEQNYIDGIARTRSELEAKTMLYGAAAPLTFIMQLDLEILAHVPSVDPDFPQEGRLLVFYDMIMRPWFARDEDKQPLFQIVHDKSPKTELERRAAPELGYPLVAFSEDDPRDVPFLRNHLPAARINPIFTYTLPDNHTQPMFSRSLLTGRNVPQQTWNEDSPAHVGASNRFGGWPELIQNDMRIELAAYELNAAIPTSSVADYSAAVERLMPRAENWIHLLQFGDYDNTVWDFDGLYYIWIKREHLKAGDFAKAEMMYQTD
jgi:uncharacterized protein YwqG